MRCPKCLADLPDGVVVCPKCGASVPLPKNNEPLRKTIKFSFIVPIYTKTNRIFDEEGLLVDREVEFRLYKAIGEAREPPIIIFDKDGFINMKMREYSLTKLDIETVKKIAEAVPEKILNKILEAHNLKTQKDKKHPIISLFENNILLTPVPRLRNVDFLRNMDWRKFVEDIVDFKNVGIDPRLKLIRLTQLMRGSRQSINPHSLIVLPAQTGKSDWYKYIGVCIDKVSANSLIGYADVDGPHPGSIDNSELPIAIDQVESGLFTIFRYLLGILESGTAIVDMAAYPFEVTSKSPFSILSNPVGDPKSNFGVLIEKLSKNPALGRRFGIILYDKEAKRIRKREKDIDLLRDKVSLFRAVEEFCLPRLNKIINNEKVWNWLNNRNEEFIKQALEAIAPIENEDENLYLFLREFIENGQTHTRGGALRAAIALNLDKIALDEIDVDQLLVEAEEILSDLLKINFESLKQIASTYEETREEAILRAFDVLPSYMKEIVSAIELWRRSLSEVEKKVQLPLKFYLDTINYKPETAEYFSEIIRDARKGNPEKYNETLKEYFQFELKKEDKSIVVWLYSFEPISCLKVLGNLGNLGNLEDFKEGDIDKGKEENAFPKDFQNSQNSQISQKIEEEKPYSVTSLDKKEKSAFPESFKISQISQNSQKEEIPSSQFPKKETSSTSEEVIILWRSIAGTETCELCGKEKATIEFETPEGWVLKRCKNCFEKIKKQLPKVEWRKLNDE